MRVVAISDTHNRHRHVIIPECDLLIHAGDLSSQGHMWELKNFATWANNQPAKHIILIPGNHELGWEDNWQGGVDTLLEQCPRMNILNDSFIEIDGIKIWGSPVTPWFYRWAWNRARDPRLTHVHGPYIKDHWDLIPNDIDILITHGPPRGILDFVDEYRKDLGCSDLLNKVLEVKPQYHIFGHIHNGHGEKLQDGITFINAAICDDYNMPAHEPIKFIYGA